MHKSLLRKGFIAPAKSLLNIRRALTEVHGIGELIPFLVETIERTEDLEAKTLSGPQTLHRICKDLLDDFVTKHLPGIKIDRMVSVKNSHTLDRARALQQLGRSIVEAPVRTAFEELSISQILPHLLTHHPGCQFLRDYKEFCWHWQHLAKPVEWLERPVPWKGRLEDHHLYIYAVKNAYLGKDQDIEEVTGKEAEERKKAEDEARVLLRGKDASLLHEFSLLLHWTQYWQPTLNERGIWTRARTVMLELVWQVGANLMSEGILDDPQDILLITPEELEDIGMNIGSKDYQAFLKARKREYHRNLRLRAPEILGQPRPKQPSKSEKGKSVSPARGTSEDETTLFGNGMTPWHTQGTARVTDNLRDPGLLDQLSEKDILVCLAPSLNYHEDWYTLLATVSGVVVLQSYGGGLKHVVQVAREFGVAVIELPDGELDTIPPGSSIIVDGKAGTIRLL